MSGHLVKICCILVGLTLAGCSDDNEPPPGPWPGGGPAPAVTWKAFEIAALADSITASGQVEFQFLSELSMEASYIELPAGQTDSRDLTSQDQVYYIVSGESKMEVIGLDFSVSTGDVVFIKGGKNGRFSSISEDLSVVITSMKTPTDPSAPDWHFFGSNEIQSPRNNGSNVWNPFLQRSNVVMGLYMLPQNIGGDQRLVHGFEELNIVVKGTGSFRMDSDEISIKEGSIVFVKNGLGHFFRSLTSDIDVLILWEQP